MNNDVKSQAPSESERRKAAALVQVRFAEIQLKFADANTGISTSQARKLANLMVENAVRGGKRVRLGFGDDKSAVVSNEAAYDLMVAASRAKVSLGRYVDRELKREEALLSSIESHLNSIESLVGQLPPTNSGPNWESRDEIKERCWNIALALGS